MRAFSGIFVLCTIFLSILTGEILASQCPSCVDAESNACRRWGSGRAKFQWASGDRVSSSISLTAGSCGQGGESAVGYIMLDCDTHSSICNGDGSPCDDDLYSDGAFAIVKVTGSKKAFQQIFPGGISFTGDKVYTSDGRQYYIATAIGQANCEYQVPLQSAGHARIKVSAGVSSCDEEFSNSRFNIQVKFFQQLSDQYGNKKYTLLAATKGAISVKRNDGRSFDAVNFKPDLRDGSSISKKKGNYRAYTEEGGQSEWKQDYRGESGEFGECESQEGWCGEVSVDNAVLVPESQTFYRVKYPGWKESTNGQPPYAANTGWDYNGSSNRLSYSMGNIGTMYYHCESTSDGSVRVRRVERCDEGEDAGQGNIEWTVVYDDLDRIKYIHNASYSDPNIIFDPNTLDNATQAYEYNYEGAGNDPEVAYKTRPDTLSGWSTDRQWELEFDENGQATKFIGGCSSGCSGSGSFEHIEYHPTYTDQILWQKNADGNIILQNEYEVIEYGEYEDAGWMYIPDSGFESQDVSAGNCDAFDENQSSWSIDVNGGDDSTKICDPNSGSGQYLMLYGTSPDILYQDLSAVMLNTVYDLDVIIRGHSGASDSYAMIILNAIQGANTEELAVIDVNDFDLTDGQWRTKSLQWDSTPYCDPEGEIYLIDNDNPWVLQLVVTGNKVDIDEFHMATGIWVGDQTKALIKKQERINPATEQLVTVLERDYNESSTPRKMTERRYVSSNVCRVTVYEYEDEAFTNIIKQTEYEDTGTDTSLPTGDVYVTTYGGNDPNEIYIAVAPNGKRADYQRYEYGNLVESYVINLDNDVNSLREVYTYDDVENSENFLTELPDWRILSHTNARGGVTEYQYTTENGIHLLEKQVAPATSAGRQEITYVYDDARRVIKEIRKDTNGNNHITAYDYNPKTGYLDSVTVGNATTTYWYNNFGQVTRQFTPDGVMTGKSYGTGGELLSEFVIEENSDPNDADALLTLISQTRYTYTDEGQIELIGKYKSDSSFSYQSSMETDPDNWTITKYEYYSDGKKKKTIEDHGTGRANLTTEYFYNYQGEIEKILYPTGKWIKTTRDGRGLVILEQTGYGADTVVLETAYSYDTNGNLQQQSNPDGSILIYTYDNFDRLKRTYKGSTSGTYIENFYNNAGDVIRQIACEADGTIISDSRMDYDVLGNLKSEWVCADPNHPDGLNDLVTNYVYDIAGNLRYEIRAGLLNPDPNQTPDPNDIITEYVYDSQGRRTHTIEPEGIVHSVFYTAGGLPKIIIDPNDPADPNAFITENFYDAYGRLEKSVDPMGHYTQYTHNSLNQITQQIIYDCNETPLDTADDFAVRQQRIEYDNLGNVIQQAVMANPASTSVVSLGVDLVTDFVFDPNDGLLKQQKTYYGTGPTTAITTFGYDNIGRRTSTTDPEGNQEVITYYSDDVKNALIQKIEQTEVNSENPQIYYTITTFFEYDSNGRLSARILDEDGDGTSDATDPETAFTYDVLDRLKTETAPDNVVTFYEYDGFGNVKTKIEDYVDGTPDIDADRTTEFVYNRLNQQYQVKAYDPNETTSQTGVQTTTYEYDKNGNVTKIIYPDGKYVEYVYNLLNKVDTEIKRDGTEIYYWYDWRSRLTVESDDPDGFDSTLTPHLLTEFKYDAADNLVYAWKAIDLDEVSESSFTYNGFGARTSETAQYDDDITKTTVWTYDGSGNRLTQTHGDTVLSYTHDGLGRIKSIDKGNDEIVSYTYLGQNTQSIDYPEAETTQNFYYDELGRIEECESIDPNDQTILDFIYTYDNVGNRDTCKYNHLATPVYDVYEYDNLRRLTDVTYADDDGYVAFNMDRLSFDNLVLVASAWLENESTDYTDFKGYYLVNPVEEYSAADVEQVKNAILSLTKRVDDPHIKKLVNSIKTVTPVAYDPDAPIYTLVEFGEDFPKNYTSETCRDDDGNIIAQIIYDNKGRMVLFAMYPESGDIVVIVTEYDNQGNITSRTLTTLDADGKITTQVDMFAQEQETLLAESSMSAMSMSLDGGSSMVTMSSTPEAPDNKSEAFAYDHLGNRYQYTEKSGITYTYEHNAVNQYQGRNTTVLGSLEIKESYSYDDSGNLEYDSNGYCYLYDYRNRLIEVQDSNSLTQAEYAFDALGRRIKKVVGNTTTYFFYDTNNRVIAEYEDATSPVLIKEYVWGNGINEILAMFNHPELTTDQDDWDEFVEFLDAWLCEDPSDACYDSNYDDNNDDIVNLIDFASFAAVWEIYPATETRYYYLTDALGSVRGLVGGRYKDPDDYEFYNYDVYGQLSVQDGQESKSGNPYLFAAMRFDPEIDSYYTLNRTYSPSMARWLQFDPIGYADSMNLYEYVSSNPVRYFDAFGLYEEEWEGKWTEEEIKRVKDSMERVQKRCDDLIPQIKQKLQSLPTSHCYDELRKELNFLLKYMEGISNGVKSTKENLEFYQKDMGHRDTDGMAGARTPGWGHDNELYLNTNPKQDWRKKRESSLDEAIMHELSHLYGSRDPKQSWWERGPRGTWDNAHFIDNLMHSDNPLERNTDYRAMMIKAQKCEECQKERNDPNLVKEHTE